MRVSRSWAIALAAAFVALAAWVEMAGEIPGEERLLETMHARLDGRADGVMKVIDAATDTTPLAFAAAVATAVLLALRRWRDAIVLAALVVAALVINPLLKQLFARPRPTVRPIPIDVSEYAFPSGHAAMSTAVAAGLLLAVRSSRAAGPVGVVAVAFLLTVAIAQLVLGAHLPSDLVAGWLWVGALAALAVPVGGQSAPATRRTERTAGSV